MALCQASALSTETLCTFHILDGRSRMDRVRASETRQGRASWEDDREGEKLRRHGTLHTHELTNIVTAGLQLWAALSAARQEPASKQGFGGVW